MNCIVRWFRSFVTGGNNHASVHIQISHVSAADKLRIATAQQVEIQSPFHGISLFSIHLSHPFRTAKASSKSVSTQYLTIHIHTHNQKQATSSIKQTHRHSIVSTYFFVALRSSFLSLWFSSLCKFRTSAAHASAFQCFVSRTVLFFLKINIQKEEK